MQRIEPGPGQQSVWDYPLPPRLEAGKRRVRVEFRGRLIADSRKAFRVLEQGHPPTWYLPPQDVDEQFFVPSERRTFCEWKGEAHYRSLKLAEDVRPDAAWFYSEPAAAFAAIKGYIAFYPGKVDGCWLDEEPIQAQPGGYYGGWISSDVVGPFKGSADNPAH